MKIDTVQVQQQLDRRRPGQSAITTARHEDDKVQLLSGIFQGETMGTPIGFIISNKDHRSTDNEKYAFRCFLLRLGFIGAEYKTARKILLKNLSGSSAFKNGGTEDEISEQGNSRMHP